MATLLEVINSEPLNSTRDGAAVARWINERNIPVPVEYLADDIQAMNLLGSADGAAFLDMIEALSSTVSSIKWAFKSISSEGLDLGDSQIRVMLDAFVADPAFTALDQPKLDLLLAPVLALEAKSFTSIAEQNGFGTGLRARHINKARGI